MNEKEFLKTIQIELESFKQIDKDVKILIAERRAKVEFKGTIEYQKEGLKYSMAMSASNAP